MSKWPMVSHDKLSPTLEITEFVHHGFWIWDKTREMNLAMRAKTRDAAFVEVVSYYQERLKEVEKDLSELTGKVNSFLEQFPSEDDT